MTNEKTCRNCGEPDLIDNEHDMFTCTATGETVGGNNSCGDWREGKVLIKYKMDVLSRYGAAKYVSIIVNDFRIESIRVPDSVRYGIAPIKRWLDSEEGQKVIKGKYDEVSQWKQK